MISANRTGLGLVSCLLLSLVTAAPALSSEPPLRLPEVVDRLEVWLDANAPWPRRDVPPSLRWIDPVSARALVGWHRAASSQHPRGFYDERSRTIFLVQPWSLSDPQDVSVLLHELVHHRQVGHHWYCPGAQELPAYRLQEAWLAERGLSADVNWIAVVLESGCTARDIHPE